MAKIWGLGGEIIRFVKNDHELMQLGEPPVYDSKLEFDETTNAEVINGLDTDWNAHAIDSKGLKRDGVLVMLNPPSAKYLDMQVAERFKKELDDGIRLVGDTYKDWNSASDKAKLNLCLEGYGVVLHIVWRLLIFVRFLVRKKVI